MGDRQLDLFAAGRARAEPMPPTPGRPPAVACDTLDDRALIAAIPRSNLADCLALTAEAGRRRLAAAIPELEALCRRFRGFGVDHAVPEQMAAVQALARIGGAEATQAARRILLDGVVQGPGLRVAVGAAAAIGVTVPADFAARLLRHAEPDVRAGACRCAPSHPMIIAVLVELLDDLNQEVAQAAACALGRSGRSEARPVLARLLRDAPSADLIEAVLRIADEECLVLLARICRIRPDLTAAVLDALDTSDHPRAATIAAAARRSHAIAPGSHASPR